MARKGGTPEKAQKGPPMKEFVRENDQKGGTPVWAQKGPPMKEFVRENGQERGGGGRLGHKRGLL